MTRYRDLLRNFWPAFGGFFRYQIVTKLVIFGVLVPAYGVLVRGLMASQGKGVLTNSMIGSFLISWQGVLALLGGLLVIVAMLAIESGGFVVIAARAQNKQPRASVQGVFKTNVDLVRRLLAPATILLVGYLALAVPLGGMSLGMTAFKSIRIPNFITSVIFATPLYTAAYVAAVAAVAVFGFFLTFTVHFLVIAKYSPGTAMASSIRLVRHNLKLVLARRIGFLAGTFAVLFLVLAGWILIVALSFSVPTTTPFGRVLIGLLFVIQNLGIAAGAALFMPLDSFQSTGVFYEACARTPRFADVVGKFPDAELASGTSLVDRALNRKRILVPLGAGLAVLAALGIGAGLQELAKARPEVAVIAHRAGGVEAPENTVAGIEKAIALKADMAEIDVQRTKDGAYVINHDETFKRVAGESRSAQEMTLAEVREVKLAQGASVPTFEEIVRAANNKIGLAIELKGSSADIEMARDVVAILEKEKFSGSYLLMTLDHKLAAAINKEFPEVPVGFVYFLQVGDPTSLPYSTLIVEEEAAGSDNVARIQADGKAVVVWTVNKEESIEKFMDSDVDAVITDEVSKVTKVRHELAQRSDADRMRDLLFKLNG